MMLDLMLAREQDRQLSASDLATGAGVPLSSGLRMIAALEQEGLVHRAIDEKDRRRSLIRLSDAGADRMKRYFETIRRRSEEHTSELQSLMRISYAVFCLKKKTQQRASSTTIHRIKDTEG